MSVGSAAAVGTTLTRGMPGDVSHIRVASATAARSSVLAWLTEMINTTLPKSGQVRVSIVFSNAGYPGYVLLTPTVLTGAARGIDPTLSDRLRTPPPVPTTSLYSRTDGVVAWQCSVEQETAKSENIEVHASHLGYGHELETLRVIADRLAQPPIGQALNIDGDAAER